MPGGDGGLPAAEAGPDTEDALRVLEVQFPLGMGVPVPTAPYLTTGVLLSWPLCPLCGTKFQLPYE